MRFALDKFTPVRIRSVNIRAEMHGAEPVPAIDIGLHMKVSNNVLLDLDPPLKAMLYKPGGELDDEPELDGIDPHSDMPELRSTELVMPVALAREYSGMSLEIDYGLGGKSNIKVGDCEANQFKVGALEGGTIELDFRVQASGLEGSVLGQIGALVKHDVLVTLTGPDEEPTLLDADPTNPFKHSVKGNGKVVDNHPDTAPEAGDIFAASVANGATSSSPAEADTPATKHGPATKAKVASFKAKAKVALKAAAKGAAHKAP